MHLFSGCQAHSRRNMTFVFPMAKASKFYLSIFEVLSYNKALT